MYEFPAILGIDPGFLNRAIMMISIMCGSPKPSGKKNDLTPESFFFFDMGEKKISTDLGNGIVLIEIDGAISQKGGFFGGASTIKILEAIKEARDNEKVRVVILKISSPGGSVLSLADLGDAIYKLSQDEDKQVIAQIEGMCASASYYIASQANFIYSSRMDMIGSIGTIMGLYDYSKMYEEAGVRPVVLTTGKFKGTGVPGTEITPEQEAELQKIVDGYFADFQGTVLRARPQLTAQFSELAQGQMFLAEDALESNLIDGIQTFEETVNKVNDRLIQMDLEKRINGGS